MDSLIVNKLNIPSSFVPLTTEFIYSEPQNRLQSSGNSFKARAETHGKVIESDHILIISGYAYRSGYTANGYPNTYIATIDTLYPLYTESTDSYCWRIYNYGNAWTFSVSVSQYSGYYVVSRIL